MTSFLASESEEPKISISDVESGERRLSEENLLNDKDFSEDSPGFFDYLTSSTSSTKRKFGILPRLRHFIAKLTLFLLPSFISSYFTTTTGSRSGGSEKLAPTAWLDGLRGLACACVVVHHYFYEYFNQLEHPYDGINHVNWAQLPFLKLIHHGPPMVKVFFIISGFVLTVKAVKITRATGTIDGHGLMNNLSSSVWKRYLRLYIPCAAGFVLCAVMISAGMMEAIPSGPKPKWIAGPLERRPPTKDNIFQQLMYAAKDFYIFAFDLTLFNIRDRKYSTDGHLWTIPIEFRSSIQLFIFVAGTCTLKRWLRVYIIIPLATIVLLYYGGWGLALFVFGYFLAELNSDIPTNKPQERQSRTSIFKTTFHTIMAITGLFFLSYPRKLPSSEYTTGFQFLVPLTPAKYPRAGGKRTDSTHEFWQTIGSMLLVWALLYLPRVQKVVLCNKISQYFGKISFAIYIMHAQTQHSIGYWVVVNGLKLVGLWRYNVQKKVWDMVSGHNELYAAVVVGGFIFITFPTTVCWADIFWRGVDLQSVRFLRWLEPKIKR
ncbi:hypothetical protein TWF970_007361 [Orbilia oligospora]|uniref:Acyltransferase 3 domain-containing protein n=1 Tax=Orbilia oligospora TaxID=2813651 RepID=A0A7C8VN07_ORBOL|nr:hypothetical protein TWF970_007361 [Orbilia oligospora]